MATFALYRGNIISHNRPGSSTTVTAQAYEMDQWYIIRNVANLDTGTFDLYIDDMDTPVLENQTLRTSKSEINRFLFFENGTNEGDLCIDYFRVCVGTPYNYDDAGLIGLEAEGIELTKSDDTTYRGEAGAGTSSVKVVPAAANGFAEVTVNGTVFNGTDGVEVALEDGENRISVVVTAESGAVQEYTLIINRADSAALAALESLKITETALTPAFSMDVLEYTARTDLDVIHLEADPAAGGYVSKVVVNGVEQGNSMDAALDEGENIIEIEVGSEDGTSYTTYQITVTKEESVSSEADKTALLGMIAAVEKLEEEDFTKETWNALMESLKAAESVAAEELLADRDKYTDDSAAALAAALESAKEVLSDGNRTQEEIGEAYAALTEAIAGLELRGDRNVLVPLIGRAQEILAESGRYTEQSLEGLAEALAEAQAVYEDGNALQQAVNEAAAALAEKLAGVRILGDVNADGVVSTADTAAVLRASAEMEMLEGEAAEAADMNLDGIVNTSDAAQIQRVAAELE